MDDSNDLFSGLPLELKAGQAEILGEQDVSTLSHYCDLNALHSVLTNNQLWASNIQFMNDELEMEYGIEVARGIVKDYLKGGAKPNVMTYRRLRNDIPDVYACCFCVDPDLLSQWRGYGLSKQSVSIQFDRQRLSDFAKKYSADLVNIIYGASDARQLYEGLATEGSILTYYRELQGKMEGLNATALEKNLILQAAARIKDPSFREEAEWRIVAHGGQRELHFRPKEHLLVPYIKIGDPETALPVLGITVGPGKDVDLTIKSIEKFLASSSFYGNVPVVRSGVPFRS
ncbi:DUF2971 domain-containing protein [Rhizobium lentis]|uniref:DUF2971 domain-containing protein n=1 Tax=Rhizobium lentis TaxID=1138194 RepID=UPI001C835BF6|nr:DUF2971 domain-containing protein [Rhizobium lentis]MBX5145388.1 DUF2971 domain-containing protein [Rhizobium lentis]